MKIITQREFRDNSAAVMDAVEVFGDDDPWERTRG